MKRLMRFELALDAMRLALIFTSMWAFGPFAREHFGRFMVGWVTVIVFGTIPAPKWGK